MKQQTVVFGISHYLIKYFMHKVSYQGPKYTRRDTQVTDKSQTLVKKENIDNNIPAQRGKQSKRFLYTDAEGERLKYSAFTLAQLKYI